MKLSLLLLAGAAPVLSFQSTCPLAPAGRVSTSLNAYVPDGLSAAQWKEMQAKEKAKSLKSDRKQYKSRSFNSFVEAMERGEATHLMPVDPRDVKSGKIPIEEVPYMQRPGGAWDGSDLRGAAKKRAVKKQEQGMYTAGKWLQSDKDYENGGKDRVNSFFAAFGKKEEDVKTRAAKNGISQDAQMWRDSGALSRQEVARMNKGRRGGAPKIQDAQKEKKFFGLF